jgi:hypothetical protein
MFDSPQGAGNLPTEIKGRIINKLRKIKHQFTDIKYNLLRNPV